MYNGDRYAWRRRHQSEPGTWERRTFRAGNAVIPEFKLWSLREQREKDERRLARALEKVAKHQVRRENYFTEHPELGEVWRQSSTANKNPCPILYDQDGQPRDFLERAVRAEQARINAEQSEDEDANSEERTQRTRRLSAPVEFIRRRRPPSRAVLRRIRLLNTRDHETMRRGSSSEDEPTPHPQLQASRAPQTNTESRRAASTLNESRGFSGRLCHMWMTEGRCTRMYCPFTHPGRPPANPTPTATVQETPAEAPAESEEGRVPQYVFDIDDTVMFMPPTYEDERLRARAPQFFEVMRGALGQVTGVRLNGTVGVRRFNQEGADRNLTTWVNPEHLRPPVAEHIIFPPSRIAVVSPTQPMTQQTRKRDRATREAEGEE